MQTAVREAVARQREGLAHEVEVRGHTLVSDEPGHIGGNDEGPTPQELVAGALAACTAITLRLYADRKRWDVSGLEVAVESDTGESEECTFRVILRLPSRLDDEQVDRLRVIAGKCPVHRLLGRACEVEDRVEVV
jgi:putative redox protein